MKFSLFLAALLQKVTFGPPHWLKCFPAVRSTQLHSLVRAYEDKNVERIRVANYKIVKSRL